MNTYEEKFKEVGLLVPELVVPARGVDRTKYAVIACDQYSSDPSYWEDVKTFIGKESSSLYFTMPEAWLGKDGKPNSEEHQNHQDLLAANMKFFLVNGSLEELPKGAMLIKRTLKNGKVRTGLMFAIDLEKYEFEASHALIRATEETVKERIPVRAAIRSKAPLEIPHIMLLVADKENRVFNSVKPENPVYDFDLMNSCGHLTGYHLTDEKDLNNIADAFLELKEEADKKYDGMLFAVGDGNHSLAAAKAHWDKFKRYLPASQKEDHPARFALVEIVNLYDESLVIEPINRILKNCDPEAIQKELGFDAKNPPDLQDLQPKLDSYMALHPEVEIDYIHGKEECLALEKEGCLAICWDSFNRDSIYKNVVNHGKLVRKSFSIGIADDKRFYYEARRITKINKEHIVPNSSWF